MEFNLHQVVPADDLHWNEVDQKMVLLSEKETEKIVRACATCGMTDLESLMQVVKWAEHVRSGQILMKGLLDGRLGVFVSEETGEEPIFFPIEVLDEYYRNAE